jgi:diguanylate cyclase (GGDEF)-like protein
VSEELALSSEEELNVDDKAYATESAAGAAGVDAAFRRARREAWLTKATAVAVVIVLALWAIRGEAVSPAPIRYVSGIVLCAIALGVAVLMAMRSGHYRMLAERAYLIELHQTTSRARHQVLRDHLSGLYSRWYFYERLAEELSRCARYGRASSVAFLGFPAWKTLNLATQAQLIERVGYLLQNDLRTSDVATRWGPGRFVWYLPETDASQAMVAARRLAEAIQTTDAVVGAAQFPADGSSPNELMRAAEARAEAAQSAA